MRVVFPIQACIGLAVLVAFSHATEAQVASVDERADSVHHAGRRLKPKAPSRRDVMLKKRRKDKELAKRKAQKARRAREVRAAKAVDDLQQHKKNWDNYVYNAVSRDCQDDSMDLKLGEKNDRDFKCGSGTCVPLKALCNGVTNCMDSSDEAGCEMTTIQENIEKQMKENGVKPALIEMFANDLQKGRHHIPTKAKKTRIPLHIMMDRHGRINKQGRREKEMIAKGGEHELLSEPLKPKHNQARKGGYSQSLEEYGEHKPSKKRSAKQILDDATVKPSPGDKPDHRRRTVGKGRIPVHIKWDRVNGLSDTDGPHKKITVREVHRSAEGQVPHDVAARAVSTERLMMRRQEQ